MSCFESSSFRRKPEIMNQQLLMLACKALDWTFQQEGDTLKVYDVKNGRNLRGEPALIIHGNKVTFNKYYMKDGAAKTAELETQAEALFIEYGTTTVQEAFTAQGFEVKMEENMLIQPLKESTSEERQARNRRRRPTSIAHFFDKHIHPTVRDRLVQETNDQRSFEHLVMEGYTADPNETDQITRINFWILSNGDLISDSNYIPRDLHDRADAAMEQIDAWYGTSRIEGTDILRKEIPYEYESKAFCKPTAAAAGSH